MKEQNEYESLINLNSFIAYLQQTKDEDWVVDIVRSKDGKSCVMGHLVDWFYGKDYKGNILPIWDAFECMWATTYMIYPVNDGQSPKWMNYKYKQSTAKDRVIAYLKNLNEKKEKNTNDLLAEEVNVKQDERHP